MLDTVEIKTPRIPVVSNVDAAAHSDPDVIKSLLTQQVTAPVQWETTMKNMIEGGYQKGYELGPGKVVTGILKRIDRKAGMTDVVV